MIPQRNKKRVQGIVERSTGIPVKTIEQLSNEAKETLTFECGWRSRLFLYPNQRDTSGDSSPEAQAVYWIFVLLGIAAFVLIVAF
jgi:hypothetical protein